MSSNINIMKSLMTIKSTHQYNVFSYCLNKDIKLKDGSIDNLYGLIISFGSFHTEENAKKRAKEIMLISGCDRVIVLKSGNFAKLLKCNTDGDNIEKINIDSDNKIIDTFEKQQREEENRIKEEREMMNDELSIEKEKELDSEDFEYYKHNVYLAIENKSKIEAYKNQLKELEKKYDERLKNAKICFLNHNEYKEQFIPKLEVKLVKRNELELLNIIKIGYSKIKDEIC